VRSIGNNHGAASVLLVGLDAQGMGLVREVLAAEAALPPNALTFAEALPAARRAKPDVLIVAYGKEADQALALAQAASRELPGTTIIALSTKSSAEAILSAMRAGFKEFVVLPDDAARLRQSVRDARGAAGGEDDDIDADKGKVIAFAGAKGGVGTTTICANVAAELTGLARVLIIDLDLMSGDVGSVLDVQSKDTLAEVVARLDRLDERTLSASCAVHRTKLHALLTPDDPTQLEGLNADAVLQIIDTAARAYQFVLLDCGTHLDEAVGVALNVADFVVLVTTPDVLSVRDAFRRVKTWANLGVDKRRVRLVVNQWSKTAFLQLADIRQNLGLEIAATISEDRRIVDLALNEGKLIRELGRKTEVLKDLSAIVGLITEDASAIEDAPKPAAPEKKTGFLTSLFGRG
jgi:pilus assembly protein CpaE